MRCPLTLTCTAFVLVYHLKYLNSLQIITIWISECAFLLPLTISYRYLHPKQQEWLEIKRWRIGHCDSRLGDTRFHELVIVSSLCGGNDLLLDFPHSRSKIVISSLLQISSLELVSAYIRRIEEINHLINAVVEENFTDAKEKVRTNVMNIR